jgi:hypothetical protein
MSNIKIIITAMLLLAIGYTELAVAHTQPGAIGRKNLKRGGVDQFQASCFDDGAGVPDHLRLSVTDMRPRNPAQVSIQAVITATGETSAISTDPIDGDAGSSPEITMVGGAGPYQMTVTRNRSRVKGAEIYVITFHCETATGAHTGTDVEPLVVWQ